MSEDPQGTLFATLPAPPQKIEPKPAEPEHPPEDNRQRHLPFDPGDCMGVCIVGAGRG